MASNTALATSAAPSLSLQFTDTTPLRRVDRHRDVAQLPERFGRNLWSRELSGAFAAAEDHHLSELTS